jgi:hypothetical protein
MKHPPGDVWKMRPGYFRRFDEADGKGVVGCLLLIVLAGVAIYLGIVFAPILYADFSLESGVKTEISKAGAHSLDDETIAKDIIDIGRRNEIRLTRQNITIERFAGQVHVRVEYSVRVDFVILERDLTFKTEGSTFIGSL